MPIFTDSAIRSEIEFGLNLLRQQNLSEPLVFSPFSISLCVSLLHAAATGKTRDEIREALLKNSTDEEFEEYFSELLKTVLKSRDYIEVNMANHVFCVMKHPIKRSYLDTVEKLYNAGATALDFKDKVQASDTMNKFVTEATRGHILKIITPEQFEQGFVALFTNALYFKADWCWPFQAVKTQKSDFHTSSESKRSIDFMIRNPLEGLKLYSQNDQFEMLQLPYSCTDDESSFAMNIFLPKKRFGLKDALFKLTPAIIHSLLTNTKKAYCHVKIPKWEIGTNMSLNKALQTIGINLALEKYKEEFKELADNMNARIKVDEKGTTPAEREPLRIHAGLRFHAGLRQPKLIEFYANHPFLFILTKGTHPIFMGIYC
ncbi:unnamed protein product [Caenorhabditis brenneri]